MKNQVGREIPDEILARMGKTGYRGLHDRDNASYRKASTTVRALNDPQRGKLCASLREALEKCELHDGMYFGFHHHFRDGDYVINMVMQEVARMGIRDITICATSMGAAHDALEPLIKQGVIAGIQSSGVRGKIGEAISKGKFKKPAIIRSHGGRVRAIEEGDIHLDVAFIGAPTADEYGNARAVGGKSDCGVLSYSMADAKYADRVVVITDCLVPFPNTPASISMTDVDYVCVVDEIGDPKKIVSNVVRVTKDVRELMMAEYCTQIIAQSPYFKDGFSFQTGGGGAALAVMLVLTVKPYVAQRFATWGHAWEDPLNTGFQQVRTMSATAAGGLFGRGAGAGWLKNIFAANTDMVFGVVCEELGLIVALCCVLSLLLLAVFSVRSAAAGRSSYYVIASCATVTIFMAQLALNVFGSLDLLPFTGVTFPFVSKGGSSLISCWGMLAYIKAGDTRSGGSFALRTSFENARRGKKKKEAVK